MTFLKTAAATALAVALAAGAASAASIDFSTGAEHGVIDGTTETFSGVDITFSATDDVTICRIGSITGRVADRARCT